MKIDLTPRERHLIRRLEWWQFLLVSLAFAGIIFTAAQTYLVYMDTQKTLASVSQTEDLIRSLRPQEAEATALQREIQSMTHELELLRAEIESQIPWDHVMAEVSDLIPQNAQLNSMSLAGGGQVAISATTFTHEDAAQVAVVLRNSPMFASAEVVSSSSQADRSPGVSFTVQLMLANVPDR